MKPDTNCPSVLEVQGKEVGLLIPVPNGVQFFAADTWAFACDRWTFDNHREAERIIIDRCGDKSRY